MKILPGLLLALLLISYIPSFAFEKEPNDDRATATFLGFGRNEQGICTTLDDIDYWKVQTNKDGTITLNFTTSSIRCLTVTLVSGSGVELQYYSKINGAATLYFVGLSKDVYYFKINACNGISQSEYSLSASFTPEPGQNDKEPNNNLASAQPIAVNTPQEGHAGFKKDGVADLVDYFVFQAKKDAYLKVAINSLNNRKLNLSILDDNGTEIGFIRSELSGTRELPGISAGTYYIVVSPEVADFATYSLTVSPIPFSQTNDTEPNNSAALSKQLPLNGTKTGHLAFYNNHYTDDVDWYFIDIPKDGKLQLNTTSNYGADLSLALYDGDGTSILRSEKVNQNTTASIVKEGLAPGRYYVAIASLYYAPCTYTVSNNFEEATPANDAEPNNDKDHAILTEYGTIYTGHLGFAYLKNRELEDWYEINVENGAQLKYQVQSNTGYPVVLDLYSLNGTLLGSTSANNGQSSILTLTNPAPGTYFFKVSCTAGDAGSWATYTFFNALSEIAFYNTLRGTAPLFPKAPIENPNPAILKVCADGSKATHLDFVNNTSKAIGFRIKQDIDGANKDRYGWFDEPFVGSNQPQIVSVYYNHPTVMSDNSVYKEATIQLYDKQSFEVLYEYPMQIYRAPLLLVHGFLGSDESFIDFEQSVVVSKQLYPKDNSAGSPLVYRIKYPGMETFVQSKDYIRQAISNFLNSVVLPNSFSAGKVDVVAHSMGGLVTRLYIQNPYGSVPYNNDIHKFITLNTPHAGSQLADCALDQTSDCAFYINLNDWLNSENFNAENPAVYDMATESTTIDNVLNGDSKKNNRLVPTMSISSKVSNIIFDPQGECLVLAAALNSEDLFGEDNDEVVAVSSQRGGIAPSAAPFNNICHMGSMDEPVIRDRVVQLINAVPSKDYFDVNGYAPKDLSYNKKPAVKLTTETIAGLSVSITLPGHGAVVASGTILPVTVKATAGAVKVQLYIGNAAIGITTVDTVARLFTWNYTVPAEAAGAIRMMARAINANNVYTTDTLTFYAVPSAALDSITIYPPALFVPESKITQFEVYGHYADGITRNMTGDPSLHYYVADTSVAAYANTSGVAGLKADTTHMTVYSGGKTKDVTITVTSGDEYSQAGFRASATTLCKGDTARFDNYTNGKANSYTWWFPGGTPATSKKVNPAVIYQQAGSFNVRLIADFGYKQDTLLLNNYITVNDCESVKAHADNITFNNNTPLSNGAVYPNPAKDIAEIILPGTCNGNYSVAVNDLFGRKLSEKKVSLKGTNQRVKIDLRDINAGTYIIMITGDDGRREKYKVVKV